MDKETEDRISFITFIIPKFADAFKMNYQQAYFYLKKTGGFDYLYDHWWALHTENPVWAVYDIFEACNANSER
ncbi:hypothetical protein AGMMS49938_18510 [Fibrobacterales bacterium]|nr:hypothetical protein AGMMS49938_18510 [Fibrobacterales bacterium]